MQVININGALFRFNPLLSIAQLIRTLCNLHTRSRMSLRGMLISLFVTFAFVSGNELKYLNQDCDFEHDESRYNCHYIVDHFPKKVFGEFDLQCQECFLPQFTKKTFPLDNHLRSLNLTNNNIMNITAEAFAHFKALQYIHMQRNKIKNIEPNAFRGLKKLYQVNLSNNELRTLNDGFVNDLDTYSIILNNNYLKDVNEDSFRGVRNVINLYLSQNMLKNLHPDCLKHFTMLEVLYLDDNNLCHIPLGLFQNSRDLKVLNLAGNKLKSFLTGAFSGLTNLLSLNVSGNQISSFDSSVLVPLVRLTNLDISRNNFYYLEYGYITTHAPSLRVLTLNDNLWYCKVLMNVVLHLAGNGVDVTPYTVGRYKLTNVNGVACYDGIHPINGHMELEAFLKLVEAHTNNRTVC